MTAGDARPTVARRREVSHTSARSVLITVLGEYVLPRDQPVWTSTLVEVLGLFCVEPKSARQALARTAADGWLVSERVGRQVRWALTEQGRALLSEGAQRIYEFGGAQRNWDGRWLVLLVTVPETRRDLRHRLRTQLTWAGFGSPAPGVWISANTEREPEAARIIDELDVGSPAMSLTADYGAIGDVEDMVARAWELTELEVRYERFITEFSQLKPLTGNQVLHAQTSLVHEWRRFPFLDPQLPLSLLPASWSGAQAADLFGHKHDQWRPAAQRHWDELAET